MVWGASAPREDIPGSRTGRSPFSRRAGSGCAVARIGLGGYRGRMAELDPDGLREYARRDWGAPERLARRERARQPVEQKVRLAIEMYETSKASRPDWPDEATRQADLASHLRVRALLDKAAHVGAG